MWSSPREVPLQNALAAALSLLTLFVGVVHEVVGATLYPDGPAQFGGAFFWHLAGLALVIHCGCRGLGTRRNPAAAVPSLRDYTGCLGGRGLRALPCLNKERH
jgi:hypothetical protein